MELLIILALVVVGIFVLYKMVIKDEPLHTASSSQPAPAVTENSTPIVNKNGAVSDSVLDVNHDGKVDVKDAVEVVKKTRTRVKKALDQDGDGKVTKKDVKVAATKARTKAKAAVEKVTAPKARGRRSQA